MKNKQEKETDDVYGSIIKVLRKNEPRLTDDKEIPQRVMSAILELNQQTFKEVPPRSTRVRYLTYAQRLLTAASVCLLILYGAEEFFVVKKMNLLEQKTSTIRIEPVSTISRRLVKSGFPIASLKQRFPERLRLFAAKQYLSQNQHIDLFKNLTP